MICRTEEGEYFGYPWWYYWSLKLFELLLLVCYTQAQRGGSTEFQVCGQREEMEDEMVVRGQAVVWAVLDHRVGVQ